MTSHFIVSSAAFAKAIALVAAVVLSNPIVPILENVLIVGTGSVVGEAASLKLVCGNFETQLLADLAVECFANFAVCVPAKKLLATLKGFPDAPVTCTVDEESYLFELSVGRSHYKLVGEKAVDFPRMASLQRLFHIITLPENQLRAALMATLVTAGVNDARVAMNAILVDGDNYALRFVGIGGNRIGQWAFDADHEYADQIEWSTAVKFLIPRQPAQLLVSQLDPKSIEPVTLQVDKTNVRTRDGSWMARLLDETPWDYQQVMPGLGGQMIDVERDELLVALRRLANYTPEVTDLVVMQSDQPFELKLSAYNAQWSSEGSEVVACSYEGDPFSIGFPLGQMVQLLGIRSSGRIRLHMAGPNRAMLLTLAEEENAPIMTCLIMPSYINAAATV